MSKLVVYDPVFGAFFIKSAEFDAVRNRVKNDLGEAVFKLGYSADNSEGATSALRKAFTANKITPIVPQGVITNLNYAETADSIGNQYKKVRVTLVKNDQELLLSVDLGTDVAKRLVAKLTNYPSGQEVKISAWAMAENKNGRRFINHSVSIKDSNDKEIPAKAGLFQVAKENAEKIIAVTGITDRKVIETLKKSEQEKLFLRELMDSAEVLRNAIGACA